ncbi:MAG: Helix-turn-helix domain [Thermoleophilaceae bacterium]|jgi:transcriptional regulator with XRE-family HTH domain|nr:Helix-turn-helix domain [Thermoleophilaceae bacterium]
MATLYVPPRLRALRTAAGLSQRFVATKIGVSATTLRRYEHGGGRIPEEHQEHLADFFGVAVPWLMGEPYEALDPVTLVDALRTLKKQSEDLIQLVMLTIDLLRDVQEGRARVDLPKMRHAYADRFRAWDASRMGAISMILGEVAGAVA